MVRLWIPSKTVARLLAVYGWGLIQDQESMTMMAATSRCVEWILPKLDLDALASTRQTQIPSPETTSDGAVVAKTSMSWPEALPVPLLFAIMADTGMPCGKTTTTPKATPSSQHSDFESVLKQLSSLPSCNEKRPEKKDNEKYVGWNELIQSSRKKNQNR